MPEKKLTGRIAADRIRMQSTPKPPDGAVGRFIALGECSSLISDVMDELGHSKQAFRPFVRPTDETLVLVGRARTGLYTKTYSVGPGENPYLDITRLTRDTGFAPAFDVAAAVADCAAFRADNPR